MPAPDYETIFNVEAAVEAAFKTVAATATGESVLVTFQDASKSSARVEIQAESAGTREQFQRDRAGNQILSVWDMRLVATVCTDRRKAQSHRLICSKLRNAFQPFRLNFGSDVLPYHAVSYIAESGSRHLVANDEDITELSWSLIVSVRKDAWPEV